MTETNFPFPEPTYPDSPYKEQEPVVQNKMHHSPTMGFIAKSLSNAQLNFHAVLKANENPAFRSKYADLATVIGATQEALAKEGLVVIQSPTTKGKDLTLTTMLLHSSGEWLSSELTMPATMRERFDAQSVGSAITYARRYALQAMIGVAGEDDDGNAATDVGSKEAQLKVATKKLADKGVTPSLFYVWFDESQTAEITGAESLKTENKDLLKKLWNSTAGAIVANGDQLEALKYELEKRGVPFAPLKAK